MNKSIQIVWDLVEEICSDLKFVSIRNDIYIVSIASKIKDWIKNKKKSSWPTPDCVASTSDLFLYEIIANSINYCYWFGSSDIRPNGSQTTKMYSLLEDCFIELNDARKKNTFSATHEVELLIDSFKSKISAERFPMISPRMNHLNEIKKDKSLGYLGKEPPDRDGSLWINYLIDRYPGYANDLFLKRAILFILQINRKLGLYSDFVKDLPIPADYQVPKMLKYFGCIGYTMDLEMRIAEGELIPEGSREEIEIRAASIKTCRLIAEEANCTCNDVDSFLWLNRKECPDNFHLTITTNY